MKASMDIEERVMRALRQICREIDLHSRRLAREHDLTTPQLLSMRELEAAGALMPSELAGRVSLSQATVTGIVDRLVARQYMSRERDVQDKRRVILRVTELGRAALNAAPGPLHDRLALHLQAMSESEREAIASVLTQVATLMGDESL